MHIAIPHDIMEGSPDLREGVRKLGYVARAAGIYRITRVLVYTHGLSRGRAGFIVKNLNYMVTPSYLRKDLFSLDRDLRYAGLLPPLKIPSHAPSGLPRRGELREGVVVRWDGYYSIVKIGEGVFAKVPKPLPLGSRVVVSIEAPTAREDTFRAHVVPRDSIKEYWGFDVEVVGIRDILSRYDSVILTGREGVNYLERLDHLRRALSASRVVVVFGSPRFGVDEILRSEGLGRVLEENPMINFIPNQGVETVRTEEAVLIVLSLINHILATGGPRP